MVKDMRDLDLSRAMIGARNESPSTPDLPKWREAAAQIRASSPEVAFRAGYLFCLQLSDMPAPGAPPFDDEEAKADFDAKILDWLETNFSDID